MPTWAQQIKGVVIDQKSKETLIGAVITVDGTNVKAITNIDGNFLIDGLKKDKTYYFKVRAFNKSGKTTYKSSYSTVKKIVVK